MEGGDTFKLHLQKWQKPSNFNAKRSNTATATNIPTSLTFESSIRHLKYIAEFDLIPIMIVEFVD
jgi:hypothetical protein